MNAAIPNSVKWYKARPQTKIFYKSLMRPIKTDKNQIFLVKNKKKNEIFNPVHTFRDQGSIRRFHHRKKFPTQPRDGGDVLTIYPETRILPKVDQVR